MKLYYHPLSTYCRKVLVTCYEKNIPFQGEIVNLFDPQAKEDYKKNVNAYGKVPFLVLDDGWKIPESSIIMEYLDTHYSTGPRLIPEDKDLARQARFHDRMGDNYLINPTSFLFFENMKPAAQRDTARIEKETQTINITMNKLNTMLEGKQYLLNNQFTMADIAPSAGIGMLKMMNYNLNDWPNVNKWYEGMMARESWKRVTKESEPYMNAFKK